MEQMGQMEQLEPGQMALDVLGQMALQMKHMEQMEGTEQMDALGQMTQLVKGQMDLKQMEQKE